MRKGARAGRKKQLETSGWKWLQLRLPVEVYDALRRFCFDRNLKAATWLREYIEDELQKAGLLKLVVTRSEGREVRAYELPKR